MSLLNFYCECFAYGYDVENSNAVSVFNSKLSLQVFAALELLCFSASGAFKNHR